jgi:hypothetical protein
LRAQGVISGQGGRFPLLIQIERDKYIELSGLDENFIEEAKNWTKSKQSEVADRTSTTLADLLMSLLVAYPFSTIRASLRW